jgi:hypothetical protein
MEPHLPFIIYLPGKIQECLPAPSILQVFPPPEVNLTSSKVLYEEPALPKVIYIEPSLPNVIYLPGKIYVLHNNRFKIIGVLLVLLFCITYFCLDFSAITSLIFEQSPAENKNIQDYSRNDILETEIEYLQSSDLDSNNIDKYNPSELPSD